jgi:hypothetical protein
MFNSDICDVELGCQYGWSAGFCIAAGVLWLVTGTAFCVMPKEPRVKRDDGAFVPPPPPPVHEQAYAVATGLEPEKEITRTLNPDGTVTVVTRSTVTNPDGSKTVTETTEIESQQDDDAFGSSLPPPPPPQSVPNMQEQASEVTTSGLEPVPVKEILHTPNTDGTVTVVTRIITTNPDGSKTVTETTEIEKS